MSGTRRCWHGWRTSKSLADRCRSKTVVAIAKTDDGHHLRAIHWHLFQDVYEWAGEYRTISIHGGQAAALDVTGATRAFQSLHARPNPSIGWLGNP